MIWPKDRFTRFEVARLLGARSLQIALGAPVLVKKRGTASALAKAEFKKAIIPITIKRKMPDGAHMAVNAKEAIKNWVKERKGKI